MSSSIKVNYVIRPNKNVERKLIFKLLENINQEFKLISYQYIGFGGFVFSDFIMAHKTFGITSLLSMEKEGFARRADFNKPYKCVRVIGKESSKALVDIEIERKKSIIWLDYDTGVQGPAMDDCIYISERASSGTCLFVTLNADPSNLNDSNQCDVSRTDNLRHYVGDKLIPADLKPKDMSVKNYPSTLAEIVFTRINTTVINSVRNVEFKPLFFFSYKDNASMITIGGIFLSKEDAVLFNRINISNELFYAKGKDKFIIDIPALTAKEKIHLDSLIPDEKLNATDVSKKLKFEMPENHLDAYKLFYSQYPVFGEVAF